MTQGPTTLADLLDAASRRHNGASGRRLAELAHAAGFEVSHATLNRVRRGTYGSTPTAATIEAIAHLAGVPSEAAFAAATTEAQLESRRTEQRLVELATQADDAEAYARAADGYTEDDDISEILEALDDLLDAVYDLARSAQRIAAAGVGGPGKLAELKSQRRKTARGKSTRTKPDPPAEPLLTFGGTYTGEQSIEDDEMLRRARAHSPELPGARS
ncbi:hypothetical protein ACFXG4_08610 [Nocardia sp. NPDC059246]|uniref:hypothetical protein n=1 Tax=unclassified Nocardia TaxID=2637762 RepID=UPI0036BBD4B0